MTLAAASLVSLALAAACGSSDARSSEAEGPENGGSSSGGPDGVLGGNDGGPATGVGPSTGRDPVDCEEAKTSKSYVGCDYWPTITPNGVASIFDYVAVVANTGTVEAKVTVTGPSATNKTVTVPAGSLKKIYLPWVPELKGPDGSAFSGPSGAPKSLIANGGAYHLVSSSPVIVYQFNALEYQGEGGESPTGGPKDWSACPGGKKLCFSFTNDAALLLPSTAMTGNYRVTGMHGHNGGLLTINLPTVLTITATAPGTTVKIALAKAAGFAAGAGVTAASGGSTATITLANAGDVAQLVSTGNDASDFSGSLVQADKPVQVITSVPCIFLPAGVVAADHIEETVMPAETLGKHYVVATPTGATGTPAKHIVRFYGNRDSTKLTYAPSKPKGCPDTLEAGQTVECGVVADSFEITGDQEFAVASFLLGASSYPDSDQLGDPSQTTYPAVEQFRTKYVFLAPNDYPVRWADVTGPEDAAIQLDGAAVTTAWSKIGAGPFGVTRVDLTKSGKDGAHVLTSAKPVGIEVSGYGRNTSFQYPAGLNLNLIAPPPAGPK